MQDYDNPRAVAALKFIQLFTSLGLFVVPPLLFGLIVVEPLKNYLQLDKVSGLKEIFWVFAIMMASMPLINWMVEFNEALHLPSWLSGVEQWMKESEERAKVITEAMLVMPDKGTLFYNLVVIALIPAIGEELLFRGVVQKIFTQVTKSHHWGIWIAAAAFSALHFQFYGFLPRMMFGVLFGYLLVWSGSLWLPILAHFFNNGMAVMIHYWSQGNNMEDDLEQLGTMDGGLFWYTLLALPVVAALLFGLYRNYHRADRTTGLSM